jgi:two-component system, NarL family, nitrate/nitrite response regulator NarL
LGRNEKTRSTAEPRPSLTAREREIGLLAARGFRNKAIARELNLCEGTVKVHVHKIFRKLRINSRMVLAARPNLIL